jgi:hypothetical protein
MATTVGQHTVATFTSPVNGTTPIDANTVRGNDNTLRTSYNDHDSDTGIHVQSSTFASRPVAGTAGRKWITVDVGGDLHLWYDNGTTWEEVGNSSVEVLCIANSDLTAGDVVKVVGFNNGQSLPIIDIVDSGDDVGFGVVDVDIANGSTGYVVNTGIARDFDTSAFAVGDILYKDTSGGFTTTKPTSGEYQPCGIVLRSNANNGVLYVEFSAPRIVERSTNTASTVVLRDASGNFAAGTITAGALTSTGLVTFASLKGTGATTVTNILDEDNMVSDSATALATQQSIKAYVDSQVATVDTLAEILVNGNTSGGTNLIMSAGDTLTADTIAETTVGAGVTIDSVLLKDDVVNATDIETGTLSANDGTTAATIANTTGKLTISAAPTVSALTASQAVFTDASKNLVSNAITGTGNVVMSASPTLTGTVTAATLNATTLGGTLSTAAQPNVTSVGTLTSLTVSGSAAPIATLTSSATTTAFNINNTHANGWGSNLAIQTGGVAAGYFGTIGSLLGNTTQDLAVYATSGNGFRVYTNGNNLRAQIDSSGNLAVDTDTLFVDAVNGRVGIGTSPSYKLDVAGTAAISGDVTLSGGTANGVAYLSGSKVLTTGSSLTFDGNSLGVATSAGNMALFNSTAANGGYLTIQRSGVSKGYIGSAAQLSGGSNDDFAIRAEANLVFSLIASEQMRLTSTGLGIGKSPNYKLDVQGVIQAGDGTYGLQVGTGWGGTPTNTYLATNGASTQIVFGINGSEKVRINSSGNVGIGTNPSTILDVNGDTPVLTLRDSRTGGTWSAGTALGKLDFYTSDTTGIGAHSIASIGVEAGGQNTASPDGELVFSTGAYNTAASEKMRIGSSGNVGIGVNSSVDRLTVGPFSGNNVLTIGGGTTGNSSLYFGDGPTGSDRYRGYLDYEHSNDALVFGTSSSEKMRIDSSGRVGIGTTPALSTDMEVLELGDYGSAITAWRTNRNLYVMSNAYWDGGAGSFKYRTTGPAAYYNLNGEGPNHVWYTAGSGTAGANVTFEERMRIDSSGNLLVGTIGTDPISGRYNGFVVGSGGSIDLRHAANTSDWGISSTSGTLVNFYTDNGSSSVFAGNISVSGSTTAYNTSSDYRLKENVSASDDAGSLIDAIEVVKHDWKVGGHVRYSVIAQDLHDVVPEAVTVGDPDDAETFKNPWGVDYSKLVPMLTKEIQSLRARIASLEMN